MREEIATFLANDIKDPRILGLVTVTAVEVTRDLRHAKVFVSGYFDSSHFSLNGRIQLHSLTFFR